MNILPRSYTRSEHALFNFRTKHSDWLRCNLALLLLVFVVGTMVYAGHHHDEQVQGHHQVCDYCLGFAHLGATPAAAIVPLKPFVTAFIPLLRQWVAPLQLIQTVAQPRAPPFQ